MEPAARTAERRGRLLDAAIELLATAGLGATTIRAVCTRAGLHSRYFYESFTGIDAILVAVFDEVAGRFIGDIEAAAESAGGDARDRIHAGLARVAALVAEQPALVRVMAVEAIGNEELNRRRITFLHQIATRIEQDAYRMYGDPSPGERIGRLSARFLAAGLAEAVIAWVDGDVGGEVEEMASDVMELVLAVSERARALAGSRPRGRGPAGAPGSGAG